MEGRSNLKFKNLTLKITAFQVRLQSGKIIFQVKIREFFGFFNYFIRIAIFFSKKTKKTKKPHLF